jgi:type IV pilus assembly protein PilY1
MNTYIKSNLVKKSISLLTITSLLMSNLAYAAQPSLATQPLGAAVSNVKPNLMFVLDGSGSMKKDVPNDTFSDYGQCKAAVKNVNSLASITKMAIGSANPYKPSNPNTRLTLFTTSHSKVVGDVVYLAIPGKPTLSGKYAIKAVNGATTGCISAPILTVNDPFKFNEIAENAGTTTYIPDIAPTNTNPTKVGEASPTIVAPDKYNEFSQSIGNVVKVGEFNYVNGDPSTPGCKVVGSAPANSGNTATDLNLGGGYQTDKFNNPTSTPSSLCYWRDNRDTNGCRVTGSAPANSNNTTSDLNLGGGVVVTPDGTVTSTPSTSCYWRDRRDTLGCKIVASNPGNSYSTSEVRTYGVAVLPDGTVTSTTRTSCYWRDTADTNGCKVVSGSGYVWSPNGTVTSTPSGACGNVITGSSTGCRVVTAQPANTPNYTTNLNMGGGRLVLANGTVTTTNDTRCYWRDPMDSSACTMGTTGEFSIEVDIAADTDAFFAAGSDEVKDAYMAERWESSNCAGAWDLENIGKNGAEPPLRAAKINTLAYDPDVSYQPPPWPKKVGSGVPAPLLVDLPNLNSPSQAHNLLPSMDRAHTNNWREVRLDGTALDASGNPNSGFWGGATNSTTNVGLASVSAGMGFNRWPEMVYCDTPNRLVQFTSDREWHESTRCQRNSPGPNTTLSSPNWPYAYPALTSGLANTPNQTRSFDGASEHQNGQSKGAKNPIFDFGGGTYHAFGEQYNYAVPYYYRVKPIEYCTKADLVTCNIQSAPNTTYPFPSYVRYCKTPQPAIDLTNAQSGNCQSNYTGIDWNNDFKFPRYGLFEKTEVRSDVTSYTKSAARTDCAGTTCTYDEEMTNMANWFAYYRTRMQLMKSAAGRSFDILDGDYRVGLITIDSDPAKYLPIQDFNVGTNAQKQKWFEKLYSQVPDGGTPLRESLATVGRIFAGQHPISGFSSDDPMQYSCQSNYTLLTTDGYWNGNAGLNLSGSATVSNRDNGVAVSRPLREASAPAPDTLADVSKYYFETDLRDSTLSNCTGNLGVDVCLNDVKDSIYNQQTQHMSTYTLGLGVDGNLSFASDYKSPTTLSDYPSLVSGAKDWPVPVSDNGFAPISPSELATVDDLWHAAVNGRGEYYSAKNPQSVITGIGNMLNSIGDVAGTGSANAISSKLPVAGDNYAFSANYTTGVWTGGLFARTIDGSANLSASALWCVENETTVTPACVGTLASKVPTPSSDTRTIYTNVGGAMTAFQYANLSTVQKDYFDTPHFSGNLTQWSTLTPTQQANVTGDHLVKYLRGQAEFDEGSAIADNRLFRQRTKVLGDITDSPPTYMGKASLAYADQGYSTFAASTVSSGRSTTGKTVFVGANDGMLHAFDANNGNERWAFIPSTVLPNMWKLADKDYRNKHTNFVNGPMEVTDVCTANCGTATAIWKTILVSGLGQGGRGYFALDVTDPTSPSLLWEVNNSTLPNLGYSYGKPVTTKLANGNWVVLLTSGYNNIGTGDGQGYLYVLNAYTGAVVKTFATGAGDTSTPSGLAQVSSYASDPTSDFTSLYVYGGDLLGNLWRFDINTTASPQLLTTLVNDSSQPQPVMVQPVLAEIDGKRVVVVGTGQYLESADLLTSGYKTQSIYAFKDDDLTTSISATALRPSMVEQVFTTATDGNSRTISANTVDWSTKRGWYIDLDSGERQNIKASLVAGILFVPTLVPSTGSCDTNGRGWFNIFDINSGSNVIGQTVVSYKTISPIAGFNIVATKNADGTTTVSVDIRNTDGNSSDVVPDLPLGAPGSFKNTRAIWRELIE